MERIDKDYLFVCQLKEILHDFNLPRVNVWTEDTVPRETRLYIKDGWVVRYLNGKFIRLYEYSYNWPEVNFTKNLIINSSVYDEYTHNYLGDYLRFLRDYHKINLMGMYNCFFNQRPSKIYKIFKDGTDTIYKIDTDDNNYTYYTVPIKFDQVYTIGIDSSIPYDIACILYNNKFISSTPVELVKQSLMRVPGSSLKRPFIYNTSFECVDKHWRKERDLKLVLKLPRSFNSSITILEGNYLDHSDYLDFKLVPEFIYNTEEKVEIKDKDGNVKTRTKYMYPIVYGSRNSLLQYNSHISYPLSERLLEYFVGGVIYPLDNISKNVERVQNSRLIHTFNAYGLWTDKLRHEIYKVLIDTSKINDYCDLTGYIDKDVEDLLGMNSEQ